MTPVRRRLLQSAIVILVAGAVAAAWIIRTSDQKPAQDSVRIPVRVEYPVRRVLEETVTAYGNVRSDNQVTILPKVSGAVTRIFAEVGDVVDTGSLLAEIDREVYELDLKRAEAAYTSAASTWERVDRLYQSGNATRQNWEEARAAHLASEAQAASARLRYNWTRIPSPAGGVVLSRHTNVGSLVSPEAGTPLFTVGSLENLEVELHIPESRYPAFSSGSIELRVFAESFPDVPLTAEIRSVAPWVDPHTRSFSVVCRILPDQISRQFLRPGMLLTVSFITRVSDSVLTLPETALSSGRQIWTVDDGNRASSVELVNINLNSGYLVVPDSLEGVPIVIEGHHFLNENSEVLILNGEI